MDTNITSASLAAEFKKAKAEDLPALVQKAIDALAGAETALSSANSSISTLSDQLSSANSSNSTLTEQLNSANSNISTLTGQLNSANSQNSDLQTQLNSEKDKTAELSDSLDEALKEVETLAKKVDVLGRNQEPGQMIIGHNGVDHVLIGSNFIFPKIGKLTAEQLSQRPDLLDKMLESKSAAFVPVSDLPATADTE